METARGAVKAATSRVGDRGAQDRLDDHPVDPHGGLSGNHARRAIASLKSVKDRQTLPGALHRRNDRRTGRPRGKRRRLPVDPRSHAETMGAGLAPVVSRTDSRDVNRTRRHGVVRTPRPGHEPGADGCRSAAGPARRWHIVTALAAGAAILLCDTGWLAWADINARARWDTCLN